MLKWHLTVSRASGGKVDTLPSLEWVSIVYVQEFATEQTHLVDQQFKQGLITWLPCNDPSSIQTKYDVTEVDD